MIPSVVARQSRETILDYLRTTFALADPSFESALFDFLDSKEGLFKGPYVDIRLPFRKAGAGERIPLDVQPGFEPYTHQLRAFQRLSSKDGHQPQHTLVTTGTGSGKTECFLFPILDHCWRSQGRAGVKAILLYPMNALAGDQARRLAQTLWDDERLRGKVTAGLYVGGKGEHGVVTRDHLIDKRDVLRDSPPDILLTNYKMLDFLLLRPEDKRLWQHNGAETLRYLVLDELHTYDGAQGSDVACLIRRLKDRLGCRPGSVCGVGTSATIGGGMTTETVGKLTEFASKVFEETFDELGVVTEDHLSPRETLGGTVDIDQLPRPNQLADLDPRQCADSSSWLIRQKQIWCGERAGDLDEVRVGDHLRRHDLLRQSLKLMDGTPKSWDQIDTGLLAREPEWGRFDPEQRRLLFESFLGLVSYARRQVQTQSGDIRLEPFLTVQIQLWVRELRHLVQEVRDVGEAPRFAWADDGAVGNPERGDHWLPIVHCRDCGSSGLGSFQREGEQVLRTELEEIGRHWLNRSRACRYVTFGHERESNGFREFLCPRCLHWQWGESAGRCDACGPTNAGSDPPETIPVRIASDLSEERVPRFLARCPDCGSDRALSMLGSRAPSLLSVAISHLYQSDYNEDKKLLAFTDSVQDASHRAGFFGARTYRFNLRTAFQSVIDSAEDGVPLGDLSERVWVHWSERMPASELVPTLWPADLREHPRYEKFLMQPDKKDRALEDELQQRLSWEAVMEFGLNAHVGRTLETTLCSTVRLDSDALKKAAEIVSLDLTEQSILESTPSEGFSQEAVEHFLKGLLLRLRLRGGIDHPMLRSYIKESGSWFLLTKRKNRLMSPFRRESVLPRMLTDRAREPGTDPVFDTFLSRPTQLTWYRDWAARSLGIDMGDEGVNDLYRESVKRLEGAGLLSRHELKKHGTAWALNQASLLVSSDTRQLTCAACRRRIVVSASEVTRWEGKRCTQYRCDGVLTLDSEQSQSYYGKIYRSGRLKRIFAQEHTGLLSNEERRRVEELFKEGTKPGAPNLFVCTPTLELGIDIGDLSAAMLCSVPPTTANYLQRIGRTGRRTGNAFCLTLANSRPHDLYFQAEPMEMIAGQVLPPGCFLDAPEMLRRQLVAHAMDTWARREETVPRIPRRTSFVLSAAGRSQFPGRFLRFFADHRKAITTSFLARFEGYLREENKERLREFASGDAIPELVNGAFDAVSAELEDLRAIQRRTKERLQEIEKDPEVVSDPELERGDLEETRKLVARLIEEQTAKYPLNVLTDEGVLPNYAFPEPGVRLESVVSERLDDGQYAYKAREYIRPASSAIREFAPFNTFYAEGRKVRIDEIDIGSKTRPLIESWRLCPECNHTSQEMEGAALSTECPRCGAVNWSDAGQVRSLVHFRRSRSLAVRLEASTVDDTEDREETYYDTLDLIDVGKEHWTSGQLIEELPFGYELLKGLTLKELNLGQAAQASKDGLKIAGTGVGERGFEVCLECGRVRDGGEVRHAAYCKARKTGIAEKVGSLYLYRKIASEAIRVLLPVSEIELDQTRASFKAALQLGFRRHFQGDPGHLLIKAMREPIRGGYGVRQFLVIFDAVPGGTGYLSDLVQQENFLDVLERALGALQSCPCQRQPGQDGCYRCLYAYQSQRDLKILSSRQAQRILKEILDHRADFKQVHTLSDAKLESRIESELERKFLLALKQHATSHKGWSWEERLKGGELRWVLRTPEQVWEIQAQVDIGSAQGVPTASRPDFLIRSLSQGPEVKPVAVFCDGLAFHACPDQEHGRIGDDIQKRSSLVNSGKFCVWSVTWKDVHQFEEGSDDICTMFGGLNQPKLGAVAAEVGLTLTRTIGQRGSMETLLSYLENPDPGQWVKLAQTYGVAWLLAGPLIEVPVADRLEEQLHSEEVRFDRSPIGSTGPTEAIVSRQYWNTWFAALARCSMDSLKTGQSDQVRFTLRLFDEPAGRIDTDFEASWRSFLQAWNLLQFHDKVSVYSSEFLDTQYYPESAEMGGASLAAESLDKAEDGDMDEPAAELEELLRYSTGASRPLIEAIAQAALPLPAYDVELPTQGDRCGVEPELAWQDLKIAVLSERQAEDQSVLQKANWKVLVHPVRPEDLLKIVKEETRVAAEREAGS